jgi:protein ImuB
MSRIVSVWLRGWPIARLLRAQVRIQSCVAPADAGMPEACLRHDRPLALVAPGKGGPCIVALNRAAQQGGLVVGELLSNARSKVEGLQSRDADPAADAVALRKLALWCVRYAPLVAVWDETADETSGADGLFIDITGAAHLVGGEAALLADLGRRLAAFGLSPRLAVADTAGAAWALARYGRGEGSIVPSGGEEAALAPLPLAALRLPVHALSLMRRLGLRRIGALIGLPRAPLAARVGGTVLHRLDQALGHAPEPLIPVLQPPAYAVQAAFVEPITSAEHVLGAATHLLEHLALQLARDEAGARVLRLLLFRVDGEALRLDLGLAAPSREPEHIAPLIALRLDRLAGGLDAAFGFEAAAVHVLAAEPLTDRQVRLGMGEQEAEPAALEGLARLIDRLQQRLGAGAVHGLQPHRSHIPERAVRACSGGGAVSDWSVDALSAARPLLLLPRPETAEVVALIPDGPPRQFRWRGVLHQVAGAQGPERIAPEWWHRTAEETRDYYLVEDIAGRRFWLYRAGLYGRGGDVIPQWFVHGVWG